MMKINIRICEEIIQFTKEWKNLYFKRIWIYEKLQHNFEIFVYFNTKNVAKTDSIGWK